MEMETEELIRSSWWTSTWIAVVIWACEFFVGKLNANRKLALRKLLLEEEANVVSGVGMLIGIASFFVLACWRSLLGKAVAIALSLVTGFTDLIDGRIARGNKAVSERGSSLDRMREKVHHCSCFMILAWRHPTQTADYRITIGLVALLVVMEAALTVIWRYAYNRKLPTSASDPGKWKVWMEYIALELWMLSIWAEQYWRVDVMSHTICCVNLFLLLSLIFGWKGFYNYLKRYRLISASPK